MTRIRLFPQHQRIRHSLKTLIVVVVLSIYAC